MKNKSQKNYNQKGIVDRIKVIIVLRKLSIKQAAKLINYNQGGLSGLLNGREAGISLHLFNTICNVFKINPRWLLNGVGEMNHVDKLGDNLKQEKLIKELQKELDEARMKLVQQMDVCKELQSQDFRNKKLIKQYEKAFPKTVMSYMRDRAGVKGGGLRKRPGAQV